MAVLLVSIVILLILTELSMAAISSCVEVEWCDRIYGQQPEDVQNYGNIAPCQQHGWVPCLTVRPGYNPNTFINIRRQPLPPPFWLSSGDQQQQRSRSINKQTVDFPLGPQQTTRDLTRPPHQFQQQLTAVEPIRQILQPVEHQQQQQFNPRIQVDQNTPPPRFFPQSQKEMAERIAPQLQIEPFPRNVQPTPSNFKEPPPIFHQNQMELNLRLQQQQQQPTTTTTTFRSVTDRNEIIQLDRESAQQLVAILRSLAGTGTSIIAPAFPLPLEQQQF